MRSKSCMDYLRDYWDIQGPQLKAIPSRARLALRDWARRYSGYDEHLRQEHPAAGYLGWGDVRFAIRTVTFSGGKIHIRAEAGASEAGQVRGRVTVLGTDDQPVLHGARAEDMGIKTSGTTWQFTWDAFLSRIEVNDHPDAPRTSWRKT